MKRIVSERDMVKIWSDIPEGVAGKDRLITFVEGLGLTVDRLPDQEKPAPKAKPKAKAKAKKKGIFGK